MPTDALLFNQGLVTSPDKGTLSKGELSRATGCEYLLGTSEIHKQPGRTKANSSGLSSAILNIHNLQYDAGSDAFVAAAADGKVYESTPGTSLTFGAAAVTGLSTSAVPQFTSFEDHWIMVNGTDANRIREAGNVPGTSSPWRLLGMQPASGQTTVTVNTGAAVEGFPVSVSGDFTTPDNAVDTDVETYALGQVNSTDTSDQEIWHFTSNVVGAGRTLYIDHQGTSYTPGAATFSQRRSTTEGRYQVEYSLNDGSSYTSLFDQVGSYARTVTSVAIADGVDISAVATTRVKIRITVTFTSGSSSNMKVFDIRCNNGSTTARTTSTGVYYFVTERYVDSDGVRHESTATQISTLTEGSNITNIVVALPAAATNTFSANYVIYRSIDEDGGGYPFMYEIGTAPITATTFTDNLSLSLTSALDKSFLYETLQVLYPSGQLDVFELNSPPPKASFATYYQGSLVYIPVDTPRKVWYSVPANLSSVGAEQVPAVYSLDFQSAQNDTVVSLALANGGRSMIAYFPSYAMLVNYLPQATDAGGFDTRVKEYVSDRRGASGKLCTTSFSPNDGASTIAAAVDSLGLWITDGVGMLQNWSTDIDWLTIFSGVTLSNGILVDNPSMRRLEFLFLDTDSRWREYHFFYGELKQNGQPKITGPHLAGWRCKHYANLSGVWRGWSGDDGSDGFVFSERLQAADASEAYSSGQEVPFDVESGDVYPFALSASALVVFAYPKFNRNSTTAKSVTVVSSFHRDGRTTSTDPLTVTKTFDITANKRMFLWRYADRFRIRFQDITATALPSLVACEYDVRQLDGKGLS